MNGRNLCWIVVLALFGVMILSPGLHNSWIFLVLIFTGFLLLFAVTQTDDASEALAHIEINREAL